MLLISNYKVSITPFSRYKPPFDKSRTYDAKYLTEDADSITHNKVI